MNNSSNTYFAERMKLELKVFESNRIIKYSEEIEIFVFSGFEK